MPTATVTPLFATPFAEVSLEGTEDLNQALASLLRQRASDRYRDPELSRDPLCFRSREDLFEWPDEAVGRLKRAMLEGVCSAVMAASLSSEAEFDALRLQLRARFNIVRPDGCIPVTSLPLASWCAVYCVAAPRATPARADSGALRLNVGIGTMFMDASNWNLRPPFAAAHQLWRPQPGRMAVFPASSPHEIALNRTDEDLVLVTARARFAHADQAATPPW